MYEFNFEIVKRMVEQEEYFKLLSGELQEKELRIQLDCIIDNVDLIESNKTNNAEKKKLFEENIISGYDLNLINENELRSFIDEDVVNQILEEEKEIADNYENIEI